MKRSIVLSMLVVFVAGLSSGCVVYNRPRHGQAASRSAPARQCHPSQHWENGHCVHNGKGHGARKHDD